MKTKKYLLRFSICTLYLLCLTSCSKKLDPEEHFKKYILDPIPKSVRNIKVDQTESFYGYAYLFEFDIDRKDLKLIRDSKSLKIIPTIEYVKKCFLITYDQEGNSILLEIYEYRKQAQWFHPELWRNYDAYGYFKFNHQTDIRLLLFNTEENKAYFYTESTRKK